jgi:predicted negative regulator of RcsB-dependent stress response
MAGESAFEKRLAAETTMDRVEGLLEHFNLPPKVITFIRRHAKTLKIVLVVVVVVVVSVALYDSYRKQQREEAASALARALQVEEERKPDALAKVTAEYSSTTSALWARIELANLEMVKGSFSSAASQYNDILGKTDEKSPLFALVLYALAQAYEADAKHGEAFREYDRLKNVKGYENLAYQGMARLEEAQGNLDKAIAIFNNFLLTIGDDPSLAQVKEQVEGDVARLKSRL